MYGVPTTPSRSSSSWQVGIFSAKPKSARTPVYFLFLRLSHCTRTKQFCKSEVTHDRIFNIEETLAHLYKSKIKTIHIAQFKCLRLPKTFVKTFDYYSN